MRPAILLFFAWATLLASSAKGETPDEIRSLWGIGKTHAEIRAKIQDLKPESQPVKDHLAYVSALLPGLSHESAAIRAEVTAVMKPFVRDGSVDPRNFRALMKLMEDPVARPYAAEVLLERAPQQVGWQFLENVQPGRPWGDLETRRQVAKFFPDNSRDVIEVRQRGLADPDVQVRALSFVGLDNAGQKTSRKDWMELLRHADLSPELALQVYEAHESRTDLFSLEAVTEMIQAHPHVWDTGVRKEIEAQLDGQFEELAQRWSPAERSRMEDELVKVATSYESNALQLRWALQALGYIGVVKPSNRQALQKHPLASGEIILRSNALVLDTSFNRLQTLSDPTAPVWNAHSVRQAFAEVKVEIAKAYATEGERGLAYTKALVGQLNHNRVETNDLVIDELVEAMKVSRAADYSLLDRLNVLRENSETVLPAYLLVRLANPHKKELFDSFFGNEVAWVLQALAEEMALPESQQPESDIKGKYGEVAVAMMRKFPVNNFRLLESILKHGRRYDIKPEELLEAQEGVLHALAFDVLTVPERERAANLAATLGPLNQRMTGYLLEAKANPANAEATVQKALDQALGWVTLQGNLPPSPIGNKEAQGKRLVDLAINVHTPPEVRRLALAALSRDAAPTTLRATVASILGQPESAELHDAALSLSNVLKIREASAKAQSSLPRRARRGAANVCRFVAQTASLPIRSLKVAAVTVPFAGWLLHHDMARRIGNSRAEPIPDVLYQPLERVAQDKENLRMYMLAAARELRANFAAEEGGLDYERYRKSLNRLRVDAGQPVAAIMQRHGVTPELLADSAAFAGKYGSLRANRDTQLDDLIADLIQFKLERALQTGSGQGLVLADLVYEPEVEIDNFGGYAPGGWGDNP